MDEIIEISTAIESDKTVHEFRLRPNATVYVSLPTDLTEKEADKIIRYVRASVEVKSASKTFKGLKIYEPLVRNIR